VKPRLPYWLPAACSVALGSVSPAQAEPQPPPPAGQKQGPSSAPDLSYGYDGYRTLGEPREDFVETHLLSGFRFFVPGLKLEVRGTNALIRSIAKPSRPCATRLRSPVCRAATSRRPIRAAACPPKRSAPDSTARCSPWAAPMVCR